MVLLLVSCVKNTPPQQAGYQSTPAPLIQTPETYTEKSMLPAVPADEVARQFLLAMVTNDAETISLVSIPTKGIEILSTGQGIPQVFVKLVAKQIKSIEFQQSFPDQNNSQMSILTTDTAPHTGLKIIAVLVDDAWKIDPAPFIQSQLAATAIRNRSGSKPIPEESLTMQQSLELIKRLKGKYTLEDGKLVAVDLEFANIKNEQIRFLYKYSTIRSLELSDTQITEDVLPDLVTSFPDLESLGFSFLTLTDRGMIQISKLTNLKHLDIMDSKVSDDGICQLTSLTSLEMLLLSGTPISEHAAHCIAQLKHLKYMRFQKSDIAQETLVSLREALPDARIETD